MLKILWILVICFFAFTSIGCNEKNDKEVKYLTYDVYKNETIKYKNLIPSGTIDSVNNNVFLYLEVTNEGLKALEEGVEEFIIETDEYKYVIKINILPQKPTIVVDDTIIIGLYETKEIEFDVINANKSDVVITSSIESLVVNEYTVTPNVITSGCIYLQIGDDVTTKVVVNIEVEDITITINNDILEMDITEKYELDYSYPTYFKDKVVFKSANESILKVDENGIVTALKEGKTSITVSFENYSYIRDKITLKVNVDPIKVIEALHIDNVLMKKDVKTVANFNYVQDVYGSVSRYFFSDLNLIEDIKVINENDYTGLKATKEILEVVEPLKKVRPGIYLEELKYIIYHDTGNNKEGSDALMHSQFMSGNWNIEYNRARSWHYTVDENSVYHHIPDNEVTWQGDSYDAYAKSIGIETCINYGCDLYTVWRRTGKLMASLIDKYNLIDVSCIRQHYDMSGKDCPRTLRLNNLYSYAIDLVDGELLFLRAMNGYNVEFKSLSPEYLDNTGKIIKNPENDVVVSYSVTITNDSGYNETTTLQSTVKKAC